MQLPKDRSLPPTPVEREKIVVARRLPVSELAITWVGHSTFLIQIGGLNLLTDPIWSERASPVAFAGPKRLTRPGIPFEMIPDIDYVLLSHDHYDHLDTETVSSICSRFPDAAWFVPLRLGRFLRKHSVQILREMDWWHSSKENGVTVACTPAQHFSGRSLLSRNRTLWCGWAVRGGGQSVFFAGDTALHPEFGIISSTFGPFDAAILPIGAYEPRWFMAAVHMNPADSVVAWEELQQPGADRPAAFVASHWGTFKLTDELLSEPPTKLRQLWKAKGLASEDLWIMRPGERRILR